MGCGHIRHLKMLVIVVFLLLVLLVLSLVNINFEAGGMFKSAVHQSRDLCPCHVTATHGDRPSRMTSKLEGNDGTAIEILTSPCTSRYGKAVLQDDITVVYNRVQKCGSRALIQAVRFLVKKNGLHGPVSMVPPKFREELPLLMRTVDGVKNKERAFVEGHVRFHPINDERVYFINMIRDPLNRLVSSYYFNRYGDGLLSPEQLKVLRQRTKPEVISETFDECVDHERESCTGSKILSHVMGFFCGHHPMCRKPTEWTLAEAKRNLDHYTVVGLVEEYNESMRALEFLFPSMLKGLVKKHTRMSTETAFKSKAHAHHLVPPSPRIAALMKTRLKLEYDFYEYAKARFHHLLDDLHLREERGRR